MAPTSVPPHVIVILVFGFYLNMIAMLNAHALAMAISIEEIHLIILQSRQRFMSRCLRMLQRRRFQSTLVWNMCQERRIAPRIWMRKQPQEWWNKFLANEHTLSEKVWLENFRMSRHTFNYLCNQVRHDMMPAENTVGPPIPVEKRVAIALYELASCAEYKTVGNLFGVHKTSVHRCLYSFCNAVIKNMMNHITLPSSEEAQALANATYHAKHFPQIWGAIDGSHIPITAPASGYRDFINRKGWTSYILQAIVDQSCRFRNINCKVPGSAHDATVLKESEIYKQQHHLPQGTLVFEGCETPIPLMLAGDPAYPLLPWIMKGYVGTSLSAEQESFNVYLSSAHMVVESAFGRLKGRWRILLKKSEVNHTFMPNIAATCCILHNLCEESKDRYMDTWDNIREDYEQVFPQPFPRASQGGDPCIKTLRDDIASFLASKFPLRKSFR